MLPVLQNGMEAQYGEHYAQKVDDRLLHYLHQLETVLPGDTVIDKVCVYMLHKHFVVSLFVAKSDLKNAITSNYDGNFTHLNMFTRS